MASFAAADGAPEEETSAPRPLQVVKTGDAADNYSFTLEEENLDFVLSQVPQDMKVSQGALAVLAYSTIDVRVLKRGVQHLLHDMYMTVIRLRRF
jgi:hypothetical protein